MMYLNANIPYKKTFDLKNISTFYVNIKSLTSLTGGSDQLEPFQITTTTTNSSGEKTTNTSSTTEFTFKVDKSSNIVFFEYTILSTQNIQVDIIEKITDNSSTKGDTKADTVDLGTTKQSTRSMSGIMIGIIITLIILAIIGGLVYYFKFIRPGQNGQNIKPNKLKKLKK